MKTLERFWQWFDAEKPTSDVAWAMAQKNLSKAAREHLTCAVGQIGIRLWPTSDWDDESLFCGVLVVHAAALRDLSLGLGRAIEAMREVVPEAPLETRASEDLGKWADSGPCYTGRDFSLLAFDEMKEWLPAAMPADTFRGVDRSRENDRPSGVRVPMSFNLRQPCVRRAPGEDRCGECAACMNCTPDRPCKRCLRGAVLACHPPKDPPPPEVRALNIQHGRDGFTSLTITPAWVRLANWDVLRGLAPSHIIMRGSQNEWAALGQLMHSFRETHLDVLVASGAELVWE